MIDALDLPDLDEEADPALHVQLATEKSAREERAVVYQQRLKQMEPAARQSQADFAGRTRGLSGDEG